MSIFDLVTSQELAAYWDEKTQDMAPYPLEELFPNNKKLGLDLKWIKGAKGLPVVLNTSAFDAKAIPRSRIGFDKLSAEMPYFKESLYIDEQIRQQLNMVLETGNEAYIQSVLTKVFDDDVQLIESAAVSRERMRAQCLTTGVVAMTSNGQTYSYDYGVPSNHKSEVATSWETPATADPVEDLRKAQQQIYEDTGVTPTRCIMNKKTFNLMRKCEKIKKAIYVLSGGVVSDLKPQTLKDHIFDELELKIAIDDKMYKDEAGANQKYIPDNLAVLLPEGTLGATWFGTTPAESDLMSSNVANVSIVDMGVAITTVEKADPVNVETIVSMICLPSFEMANHIYILDTKQGS